MKTRMGLNKGARLLQTSLRFQFCSSRAKAAFGACHWSTTRRVVPTRRGQIHGVKSLRFIIGSKAAPFVQPSLSELKFNNSSVNNSARLAFNMASKRTPMGWPIALTRLWHLSDMIWGNCAHLEHSVHHGHKPTVQPPSCISSEAFSLQT